MNAVTTDNFSPVLKERFTNPLVAKMLTKLKRNDRPKKRNVQVRTKATQGRKLPVVETVPNA